MAIFSTNQNRQFYVASGYAASVDESSDRGTIGGVKVIGAGQDKELYFLYKGADTVLKSDRIPLKNLDYVKAIDAKTMATPLKKIKVALDSGINGGLPIVGQDYVLRINLRQFYGMSDQDQYFKDSVVHIDSSIDTAAKFYTAMKDALNLSFSREVGATKTSNPYFTFSSDTNGIYLMEKEQEYTLGTQSKERVYFDVVPTTIYNGGDDVIWAAKDSTTGQYYTDQTETDSANYVFSGASQNAVGNGANIADLEYFCMGERGDQYRMIGWPNIIPTVYQVDPTLQYHVLEFHYAFTDTGVNSYRSEKDITVVIPTAKKSDLNTFIGAINSATDLEIDTLS